MMGPHAVVIVGRMATSDRYKGHDQLIDAWPLVVARIPQATLVCVGEGDDVPRLRQKANDSGVGSSIHFTGFVDEATRAAIYQRAKLLAMPSRREGFGLVYVEAMAAGVPCIGSIHDAAPDVIVDGETGYLVDQADRQGLAGRIVDVLGNDALARRLGAAGRGRYERLFTYEAFRDRLVAAVAAALPARHDEEARRQQPEVV
jgi:phosphatidylinositol alpha-1,6-mannosyltransferase